MIGFWNRREVYVGTSLDQYQRVCDALEKSRIKYKTRVVNRNNANVMGSGRARTGTAGQRLDLAYTYYVYVHKDDNEKVSPV
ncbi:hypothetical protein [Anoxynatronum buryatiense]|uniref:Uncharacterized protein n=1 Tax=Anoxynatronum buryatiense TaxID=489973 RepID=A0AA45WXA1_9CLOT|nr:hypothetical protein [Anoxynatronum buryatiense]SMP63462.1 hypothetical protein SAMN06296020_11126 [Anoxynatronum buryatiense]